MKTKYPIQKVRKGSSLAILKVGGRNRKVVTKYQMQVNRVSTPAQNHCNQWTIWGTVEVKEKPYCAVASYSLDCDEHGVFSFEIFKQPDPTKKFRGGEGSGFKEFDPFAAVQKFNYQYIDSGDAVSDQPENKVQSDEPVSLFKAAKKIERWTEVVAYDPPNKRVRVLFMEDGWEDFRVMDVDGPAHGKQLAKRFMEDGEVPEEAYI